MDGGLSRDFPSIIRYYYYEEEKSKIPIQHSS